MTKKAKLNIRFENSDKTYIFHNKKVQGTQLHFNSRLKWVHFSTKYIPHNIWDLHGEKLMTYLQFKLHWCPVFIWQTYMKEWTDVTSSSTTCISQKVSIRQRKILHSQLWSLIISESLLLLDSLPDLGINFHKGLTQKKGLKTFLEW